MNRLLAAGALVASLAAASGCQAAGPEPWSGAYAYSYSAGRNAAGTGVVVDYRLTLDLARCLFTAKGYQTDETIRCSTKASAGKVDIDFASYGDGKLTDLRGNAVYQPGDVLFSLERRGGQIVTHWQAYPLPDDTPHKPAVNFVRSH